MLTCIFHDPFKASFNPPDAGDSSIVIDLDEDDIQWQQWLATLTKPGGDHLIFMNIIVSTLY